MDRHPVDADLTPFTVCVLFWVGVGGPKSYLRLKTAQEISQDPPQSWQIVPWHVESASYQGQGLSAPNELTLRSFGVFSCDNSMDKLLWDTQLCANVLLRYRLILSWFLFPSGDQCSLLSWRCISFYLGHKPGVLYIWSKTRRSPNWHTWFSLLQWGRMITLMEIELG